MIKIQIKKQIKEEAEKIDKIRFAFKNNIGYKFRNSLRKDEEEEKV